MPAFLLAKRSEETVLRAHLRGSRPLQKQKGGIGAREDLNGPEIPLWSTPFPEIAGVVPVVARRDDAPSP